MDMSAGRKPASAVFVSRRNALKGAAIVGGMAILPSQALAALGTLGGPTGVSSVRRRKGDGHLGRYLCEQVHEKLSLDLDRIIEDPSIDGERTAMALMEARCPGCGERVHPARSSLSAVIPQWQWADATA